MESYKKGEETPLPSRSFQPMNYLQVIKSQSVISLTLPLLSDGPNRTPGQGPFLTAAFGLSFRQDLNRAGRWRRGRLPWRRAKGGQEQGKRRAFSPQRNFCEAGCWGRGSGWRAVGREKQSKMRNFIWCLLHVRSTVHLISLKRYSRLEW